MWHAVCETCGQSQFDHEKVIAYQRRNKQIERVSLYDGLTAREPWAGVRVVCVDCVKDLKHWMKIEAKA